MASSHSLARVTQVKVMVDRWEESGVQGVSWRWFPGLSVVSGYMVVITLELEREGNRFMMEL